MRSSPGLFQNIDANRRKSVVLVLAAVLFLCIVGGVLGASLGATPWHGIGLAAAVGVVLALVAWHQGGAIVLAAAGAREIGKTEDPELVNVVEEMAIASGLPAPRVFVVESDALNAFATGTSPDRGIVAVTRGLRHRLRREELQGVVAHEMAHIGNYDTRIMVLMAVIVGSVAILSDVYLRSLRYGRGGRSRGKGAGLLMVLAILLAIFAPLAATLIRLAVSRRREYLADATAAALTRNPGALADALEKLSQGPPLEAANHGTQHLFVVNPFRTRQERDHAFATHPPIAERIRRLRLLAGQVARSG